VDDRERFIGTAGEVGMQAILFRDSGQLRKELAARGILPEGR